MKTSLIPGKSFFMVLALGIVLFLAAFCGTVIFILKGGDDGTIGRAAHAERIARQRASSGDRSDQ